MIREAVPRLANRSLIARLRAGGGPSHEIMVLLDKHRVLTSDQLVRLTGAPLRTVTYRLSQLASADLVDNARPSREIGSAPRYWWLTTSGARLVTGVSPPKQPSGLFAAHASTIAEVYLALTGYGPAAGVEVRQWRPDREGWHAWTRTGGTVTLTPDATLLADLTGSGAPTAAFVEVDLATTTQGALREKLRRYLAYCEDRQWAGQLPHCPPLLLLTTTEARARNFLAGAARALAADRRGRGLDYRWRGYPGAAAQVAEAERLVIAACGLVRDPAAAVTGAVWQLADPAAAERAAPIGLAELLAARVAAGQVANAWYERLETDTERARRWRILWDLSRADDLAARLGDDRAAAAFTELGRDVDALMTDRPGLADLVLAWHADPGPAQLLPLRRALLAEHAELAGAQARRLLAAPGTAAGDPRAIGAAAALLAGRLLRDWTFTPLEQPGPDRSAQHWRDQAARHADRRDQAVTEQLQALGRWARRRADPAALAAAYDDEHLLICDVCASTIGRPDPDNWQTGDVDEDDPCPRCQAGKLISYRARAGITGTDPLAELRGRFLSPRAS